MESKTKSRTKDKKYELELFDNSADIYRKSNSLIRSKGRASALCLKIFTLSIRNCQLANDNKLVAKFCGKELREIFHNSNGSFYTEIKNLIQPADERSAGILDWRIIMKDDQTEKITGLNVFTTANFDKGVLTITINDHLRDEILNLKGNYTKFSLSQMFRLKSPYSIRLYEICKSHMDKSKAKGDAGPVYTLTYEYHDLRSTLGLTSEFKTGESKELLASYTDFRRQVLDRAEKEVSEKTSICFRYEPIKVAHGAVAAIKFYIHSKEAPALPEISSHPDTSDKDQARIIGELVILFMQNGFDATTKDVTAVAEAADYDLEKIRQAVKLCRQAKNVTNPTGWMITAIRKDNYSAPENISNSLVKKDAFNHFEQNSYDFDELEKKLLE